MKNFSIILSTGLALLLAGCGGSSGVRVTQGDQQIGATAPGTVVSHQATTIVHVDMFERITTIRNGRQLPEGFLIATNTNGEQTAILKAREKRPIGLRTADILEGEPAINDTVAPASSSESQRLAKIYRDPESDTE